MRVAKLVLGPVVLLCGCDLVMGLQRHAAPSDATAPDGQGVITDASQPDDARSDWWHASWGSRRPITIDTTKLTGGVTSLPVLIKLTPSTIDYAAVAPNGADLRFLTEDHATVLAHEIDSFTAGGDTFAWVRIPSMTPSALTKLWLYYDNPTVTGTSDGAAVFADTHVSVHHLGPNGLPDATGRGHTGLAAATAMPSDTAGIVGRARDFDGTDDLITLSDADYDFTTMLSASAWVRIAAFDIEFQTIVAKGNTAWRLHRHGGDQVVSFGTTSNRTNHDTAGTSGIAGGQWHHVAIVFAAPATLLYVDGKLDASFNGAAAIDTNNLAVTIGANLESTTGGARYWDGVLDEVRISSIAHTPAWIAAEHTTVRDPAFVTIGAAQRR